MLVKWIRQNWTERPQIPPTSPDDKWALFTSTRRRRNLLSFCRQENSSFRSRGRKAGKASVESQKKNGGAQTIWQRIPLLSLAHQSPDCPFYWASWKSVALWPVWGWSIRQRLYFTSLSLAIIPEWCRRRPASSPSFRSKKKKKGEKNGPENSIMCVTSRLFSRAATFMTSCADRHLTKKLERWVSWVTWRDTRLEADKFERVAGGVGRAMLGSSSRGDVERMKLG